MFDLQIISQDGKIVRPFSAGLRVTPNDVPEGVVRLTPNAIYSGFGGSVIFMAKYDSEEEAKSAFEGAVAAYQALCEDALDNLSCAMSNVPWPHTLKFTYRLP